MAAPFDELDLRILEQLQDDGRRPFTRIAQELGVAEATVRARVSRLQRRKVVKFVADVDPIELGLVFAYVGLRIQGPALKRATEALNAIPETVYVMVTTGAYDLMAEIVCADNEDLLRLLQDEIRSVPGLVAVDTINVLRISKDQWRYSTIAAPS
jgi:Lrp/AsnC family transcriptional regulator for asnA, asnC and gidA